MAIDVKKEEKEIIKVIQEEELYNIKSIFAYYSGICQATFYNHKMEELETIKKALNDNKTKAKKSMLQKWVKSNNATLQISAYKIIGDDEDRKKLSQSYHDHTTGGEKIDPQPIIIKKTYGKKEEE